MGQKPKIKYVKKPEILADLMYGGPDPQQPVSCPDPILCQSRPGIPTLHIGKDYPLLGDGAPDLMGALSLHPVVVFSNYPSPQSCLYDASTAILGHVGAASFSCVVSSPLVVYWL